MSNPSIIAKVAGSVGALDRDQWNTLAGRANPFVSYEFLTALEDSGSVGPETGWQPAPIIIESPDGDMLGALPAYLKGHSQGEYIFDHTWADAYMRAGGRYYPKLQIAVPFTPAAGPRILVSEDKYASPLLQAAEQLCARNGLSSAHATFLDPEQCALFGEAEWMLRSGIQYHWENHNYADFEGFLEALTSRKRKAIRKEREAAQDGIDIVHLSGAQIKEHHWDAFWEFYQDTGARKWGQPYLTREAFSLFGERLGDRVLLMLALAEGEPIAGALNFIGHDTLYGRYWGCNREKRFLHFELCYYQAIEAAIGRGLKRVEAGAQGEHKLARGYVPVVIWSAHWIADPGFRDAVEDFLEQEREGVKVEQMFLDQRTPFKKG